MLLRFLFAAVLLAGCTAPVTRPSLSHSAAYEPDCQAGIDAVRTSPQGQPGPLDNLLVPRTPGFVDTIGSDPWNTDWTSQLPGGKAGLIAFLLIIVVLAIATATFWR